MKRNVLSTKVFLLMVVVAWLLSGCQILDLLLPNRSTGEIADALPDDAALQELEEAIDEMADELEDAGADEALAVTVSPITNSFTLHYKFDAETTAFHGTGEETVEVVYKSDYSTGSPSKQIFPFTKPFDGEQYTTVSGLNAGVPCTVLLKSDVDYMIIGEFLPETCAFNFVLNADLEDMNIIENNCHEFANVLENYPTFFIPPPDQQIVVLRENEEVFLDQYHSVRITDIKFGYPVNCPMQ